MTALLSLITVATFGLWIPVAQAVPGVPQRSRTFYAAVGNVVLAAVALGAGGGHLSFGWRAFWLPLVGGAVWTGGSYSAFRAAATIGLARAAGIWTPLNIVTAFVWGTLLFGELDGFSTTRFAVLAVSFVIVVFGVLLIVGSRDAPTVAVMPGSGQANLHSRALLWAVAAGVLWGSYFVPAQWARVPAQVSNFPLALGILVAAVALTLPVGEPVRLRPKVTAVQVASGLLFGTGNLTLLSLVARVGTGVGFTIAQLSLLVNAAIGMWVFKVPAPGSQASRKVLAGIALAGVGGVLIGTVK